MSCEQIHETIISDIEEVIKGVKELKKDNSMIGNKSWSSIAKATSNLTLTFPVLISRNVPIETAQIVTKACERDDVSMLQVLFSAMSITQAEDGIEYVKKIHNNLNLGGKIDLDAFIDAMDSTPIREAVSYIDAYDMIKEDMKNINYTLDDSISETGLNEYNLLKENGNYILLKENASNKVEREGIDSIIKDRVPDYFRAAYYDDFRLEFNNFSQMLYRLSQDPNSLGDNESLLLNQIYTYLNMYTNVNPADATNVIMQAMDNIRNYNTYEDLERSFDSVRTRPSISNREGLNKITSDLFNIYGRYRARIANITDSDLAKLYADNAEGQSRDQRYEEEKKVRQATDDRKAMQDRLNLKLQRQKLQLDKDKLAYEKRQNELKNRLSQVDAIQRYETDLFNRNSRMLIDSDVKKANEMIPTLMNVQFKKVVNNYPVVSSIIVGVKAKMIPLDSADIMNRIINKNRDNNFFIKFFRATTREISFVKDFVLAIDKQKSDALSFSKKGKSNKIWKILERRSTKSSISKILNTNNSAMAISTLIITADEVEALKKTNNIDMYDTKIASGIMKSYNLMAFGIVDDMMQTFKVMKDDGEYTYSTYAYSALEKEMSDTARKTIVNLAAKNNLKV